MNLSRSAKGTGASVRYFKCCIQPDVAQHEHGASFRKEESAKRLTQRPRAPKPQPPGQVLGTALELGAVAPRQGNLDGASHRIASHSTRTTQDGPRIGGPRARNLCQASVSRSRSRSSGIAGRGRETRLSKASRRIRYLSSILFFFFQV